MHTVKKIFSDFSKGKIFTVFDTETTGLHPATDKLLEIGAIQFDNKGILAEYETLINPEQYITPETTSISGITNDMVKNELPCKDILPGFLAFIKGTPLIAHNCNFDVAFINHSLEKCDLPQLEKPNIPAIDTIAIAKKIFPNLPRYKLQFLAEYFKIPVFQAHRAKDDARVCMDLFCLCYKEAINKGIIPEEPFQDQSVFRF
ncbi:MAG: 3'-5' exonuclease [Spirochaetaceae bacterium]|nr:3'-5' exonuclease [Spirochaetaceae bacterium]